MDLPKVVANMQQPFFFAVARKKMKLLISYPKKATVFYRGFFIQAERFRPLKFNTFQPISRSLAVYG